MMRVYLKIIQIWLGSDGPGFQKSSFGSGLEYLMGSKNSIR